MTPEPTSGAAAPVTSVDDMAESIAKKLSGDRALRAEFVKYRDDTVAKIKALDVEIDKAERMTKALIPRRRNSKSAEGGVVANPGQVIV